MEGSILVPFGRPPGTGAASTAKESKQPTDNKGPSRPSASPNREPVLPVGCVEDLRQLWQRSGLSTISSEIILNSWAPSTRKQYNSFLKQWIAFCELNGTSHLTSTPESVINFLATLVDQGKSFATVSSAKSAVCTFLSLLPGSTFNNDDVRISRFLKGCFRKKPPKPKYSVVWDVDSVLVNIKSCNLISDIPLAQRTRATATLLALSSPQRVSELASYTVSNMRRFDDRIVFTLGMTKNRRSSKAPTVTYSRFVEDPSLCPVEAIIRYLDATADIRGDSDKLFLTTQRPFRAALPPSIARWIREMIYSAGVDSQFGAHSTRAASSAKARDSGASLESIMEAGNWAKGSSAFMKFYNKPVTREGVQTKILRSRPC